MLRDLTSHVLTKLFEFHSFSFPGGNVAGDQGLSQALGYYAIAYATAAWSGNATILDAVNGFFPNLPEIPAYMKNALPSYSQVLNLKL